MEMSEFNERRSLIRNQLDAVNAIASDENIAELMMAASLNGLIVMDCDKHDGWVPTPICSFVVYQDLEHKEFKTMYLFPADQEIPK